MASRLVWRRSSTAVGVYAAAGLGVLGTIVAARLLGTSDFGRLTVVLAATSFFQTLLDLTVEEAVVKYGFRYSMREDWGRFHRLVRGAAAFKGIGAVLAAIALVVLAPFADGLFGTHGLQTPLLLGALLPLAQAPENLAGTTLMLRRRYDIRALFLAYSMALRLAAFAAAGSFGVTWTVFAVVLAQIAATAGVGTAGWLAYRRFPAATPVPLGDDRRPVLSFVLQSSAATGLVSVRPAITPLLVGLVTDPVQVGYFRVAQASQSAVAAITAPLRLVLLAEQTHSWERGARGRVLAEVRRYMAATGALVLVGTPIAWWLMPWIFSLVLPGYEGAVTAARICLIAAALQFVFAWTKSFPVTIGRPNLRILAHGVETVVLIPLALVLADRHGAAGAAVALAASTVAFAGLWLVLLLRISDSEAARAGREEAMPTTPA
jgi:O-antigen/teichoic acid export membrane protein